MSYIGKPSTSGTSLTWDGDSFVFSTASGYTNVIYMDVSGNDTTGQRGNASKPFLTLQAAANAAQNNDIIFIGPGTYSVNSASNTGFTMPSTLSSLSIVGSGKDLDSGTILQGLNIPVINGSLINITKTSGASITGFRIENLVLYSNSVQTTINATDAGSTPGSYMNGFGLVIRNISLKQVDTDTNYSNRGINMVNVNKYSIENVDMGGQFIRVINCCEGLYRPSPMKNVNASYLTVRIDASDSSKPLSWSYGKVQYFENCKISNNIFIGGQANISFDKQCVCGNGLTSEIGSGPSASGALSVCLSPAAVPAIRYFGRAASITFTDAVNSPIPNTITPIILDFTGANVSNDFGYGSVTYGNISLQVASGGTNRQKVTADGAVCAGVTAGDGIDYYDKFLDISQSYTQTLGGKIASRSWSGIVTLTGTGSETFNFSNRHSEGNITATVAPSSVQVTGTSTAQGVLAVSSKTATGFTVSSSPAASGDVYVTAHWDTNIANP